MHLATELEALEERVNARIDGVVSSVGELDATVKAHAKKSDERESRRSDRDEERARRDEERARRDEHHASILKEMATQIARLVARDEERDVEGGRLLSSLARDRKDINDRLDVQDRNDIQQNKKLAAIEAGQSTIEAGQVDVIAAAKIVVREAERQREAAEGRKAKLESIDRYVKILTGLAILAGVAWLIFVFAVKQVH